MIKKELIQKQVNKHLEECHESALKFIEIVTDAAGEQMQIENITFDEKNISLDLICSLAAKNLEIDVEKLTSDYLDLMALEKMIIVS